MDEQTEFDLIGGSAIHPAWRPYFDGLSDQAAPRTMTVTLYKQHKGAPITKKDIKLLWKSLDLDWFERLMFKPHYNLIFDEYANLTRGNPPFNYIGHKGAS